LLLRTVSVVLVCGWGVSGGAGVGCLGVVVAVADDVVGGSIIDGVWVGDGVVAFNVRVVFVVVYVWQCCCCRWC